MPVLLGTLPAAPNVAFVERVVEIAHLQCLIWQVTNKRLLLGIPHLGLPGKGIGPFLKVLINQKVDLLLGPGFPQILLPQLLNLHLQLLQLLLRPLVLSSLPLQLLLHLLPLRTLDARHLL